MIFFPSYRSIATYLKKIRTGVLFLALFNILNSQAQTSVALRTDGFASAGFERAMDEGVFDEVPITVNVPRIGSIELQSVIYNEQLYLPVKELFDFLRIRNRISPDFDLIEGFFMHPGDIYFIDKTNNRIVYNYKAYELQERDLIRTPSNLYLRSDLFGEIFGLECVFSFRNLTVTLNAKIELPAIREMQKELMRQNIGKLRGEKKADTTIGRTRKLFHIGMADWGVYSAQETGKAAGTRLNLGLGGLLANGEMNLSLNYFNDQPLKLRQQFFQWRHVNNNSEALTQVTAGKLYPQSVSSIFAPVIGLQFTNTPVTYRKSFGSFTLSNTTEPGWIVELYINNVLVDYTKADASGFYTFTVPMVYGNSLMKLRFYGPWGEEQMVEKFLTVPFNFVPLNRFEYTVSGGMVENDAKAVFTRANLNYGLSRRVTLGGGLEYLSSVTAGRGMPYVNASVLLGSRLLVFAEHTAGVRSKAVANYRVPSNFQVDFTYIRYAMGQTAVNVNHIEEKKLVLSMPVRGKRFNGFSRISVNQFTYPFNELSPSKVRMKYTSAECLFSSAFSGVNSNLTTFAVFDGLNDPLVYSSLSLTFRLKGIRLTPLAQYEYRQQKISTLKMEAETNIFKQGFLKLSYERNNTVNKSSLVSVGFRYNFSFAQAFFYAGKRDGTLATVQSVRGSLIIDAKTKYLGAGNQPQAGKGGINVLPFLDFNGNGRRDAGEPKAFGLKLLVNGGRIEMDKEDTLVRISGLEAYTSYYLELDKSSFDNISWQLKKAAIKVIVDPNYLKTVEVPVTIAGEVSGMVRLTEGNNAEGIARVIVNIFNEKSVLVAKVLTEADGYFSYMGLAPGQYTAAIDEGQLTRLNMQASPAISFSIRQSMEGDVAGDLNFALRRKID